VNADNWNSGLCETERNTLLDVAYGTLAWVADTSEVPFNFNRFTLTNRLKQICGTFVTLRLGSLLCGCVGSLEDREPLYRSVHENTFKSATEDPRFSPLGVNELESLDVHISILGPRVPVESIQSFHPGLHGILMIARQRRAVFLPEVAGEQGWTREETARHLCRKAGLTLDAWERDATFELFGTDAFGD
jgi:AmmeMemoRadiSam system protein A